jgi:hypothetical protein
MTTIWLGSVVFIVVVGLIASWMVSPPAGIGVGFLVSIALIIGRFSRFDSFRWIFW